MSSTVILNWTVEAENEEAEPGWMDVVVKVNGVEVARRDGIFTSFRRATEEILTETATDIIHELLNPEGLPR